MTQEREKEIVGAINSASDIVRDLTDMGELDASTARQIHAALDGGAWLLSELRTAREDSRRLDWLEGEADREALPRPESRPLSLFPLNLPITRKAIDAARTHDPHRAVTASGAANLSGEPGNG